MANTTNKKAPTTPKVEDIVKTPVVEEVKAKIETPANEENELLKAKLIEMETKMATLMQMMGGNMFQAPSTEERDIEVVSLTDGSLLITTDGIGGGQRYNFPNQFAMLLIPERDLKAIIRSMPETTREGYFYINDEKFVEENRLRSVYRNIMSDKELNGIFDKSHVDFMTVYNSASVGQKKVIVGMAINKKLNGEFVDANILIELGKACGRDLMSIETLETLMS